MGETETRSTCKQDNITLTVWQFWQGVKEKVLDMSGVQWWFGSVPTPTRSRVGLHGCWTSKFEATTGRALSGNAGPTGEGPSSEGEDYDCFLNVQWSSMQQAKSKAYFQNFQEVFVLLDGSETFCFMSFMVHHGFSRFSEARDLRQELEAMGISTAGRVDKELGTEIWDLNRSEIWEKSTTFSKRFQNASVRLSMCAVCNM